MTGSDSVSSILLYVANYSTQRSHHRDDDVDTTISMVDMMFLSLCNLSCTVVMCCESFFDPL